MAIEANQRLAEYLDDLKNVDLPANKILVKVDGETIHFDNEKDFSDWLSEHIQ